MRSLNLLQMAIRVKVTTRMRAAAAAAAVNSSALKHTPMPFTQLPRLLLRVTLHRSTNWRFVTTTKPLSKFPLALPNHKNIANLAEPTLVNHNFNNNSVSTHPILNKSMSTHQDTFPPQKPTTLNKQFKTRKSSRHRKCTSVFSQSSLNMWPTLVIFQSTRSRFKVLTVLSR